MVKFIFENQEYDYQLHEFIRYDRAMRDRIAAEATLLLPEGTPMEEPALHKMRARIRGDGESLRERSHGSEVGERRELIPGLQSWGTVPMLLGQKGVGKSTLVAEYNAALSISDRRFLDHFDPADLTADERLGSDLRVTIINVETPPAAFEDALSEAYGDEGEHNRPNVYHLPMLGGPREFDLAEPTIYEQWADILATCYVCDGTDFLSPSVLILDGMTAILSAAGKAAQYDHLYSRFRDLMREIETPSGLVVAHSTYDGTHPLGGTESWTGTDGAWFYTKSGRRRSFRTEPRMGDPEIKQAPVILGEDGRLRMRSGKPDGLVLAAHTREHSPVEGRQAADLVLEFVKKHGAGPSQREVRASVPGDNSEVDAALDALVGAGRLEKRSRAGRGGGFAYWVV